MKTSDKFFDFIDSTLVFDETSVSQKRIIGEITTEIKDLESKKEAFEDICFVIEMKLEENQVLKKRIEELERKNLKVLDYLSDKTEIMGFATIASILLDCDFRDSKEKVIEYFREKEND
jgi:hypothetical protein